MVLEKKRWQQAKELFHACLDRNGAERAKLLDSACNDDPALREEILALLRHHEDPETLIPSTAAEPLLPPSDELERYQLLEVVGQGGMGVVYRARRADGVYQGEVAIKIVHRDIAADEVIQRFWQERQILADLKHPAIARLIDGGTLGDGRPFLVMEFVQGQPIDRYCDEQGLDVGRRLDLFAEVCRAVHFAHQNLVVHRDLKPGNLLVDESGQPKLLDFGVAKLISPAAPDLTSVDTQGSRSPLTPEFASPEQISGQPVTTASDVYALGALLYLLLTGEKPLPSQGLSLSQLVEAILHQNPQPPSQRLAQKASSEEGKQAMVAAARGRNDLAQLQREVAGDLDRIVAMALHKEPSQRYASAEDLARDLDRHRQGHPVLAREPRLSYRAGKFLQRHRWPSALAALAALTLLVLGTGLLMQRNRLLLEQALSGEVTGFLEGLFQGSTPEVDQGRPVLARELLDQGALDVKHRFAEQPELRARLESTMGRAYLRLGHLDEAEDLLQSSLDTRQGIFPPPHPEWVDGLLDLAELRNARGDYLVAEELYTQAGGAVRDRGPRGEDQQLRSLVGMASTRSLQGRYEAALELQRGAVQHAADTFGNDDPRYAEALHGLGKILRLHGDFSAAHLAFQEVRDSYRQVYGELHPAVARLDHQVGLLYQEQGQFAEAEVALRKALETQAKLYRQDHPEPARAMNNLASVLLELDNLEEAEQLCNQGLQLRRQVLGADHPLVGESLNLLGLILRQQGRDAEAETAFRDALTMWRQRLGDDYIQIAAASNNLAQILRDRGDLEAAEMEMREALRIYRAEMGDEHLQVATVLNNLAFLRKKQEDLPGARHLYEEALAIMRGELGPEHPRTAVSSHNLGVLLTDLDESAQAEPLFRDAMAAFTSALPAGHPNLGLVRKNLAGSLISQGRGEEAEALLREALAIYQQAEQQPDSLLVLAARGLLAEALWGQQRHQEASDILQRDLQLGTLAHGSQSEIVVKTRQRLRQLAAARNRL